MFYISVGQILGVTKVKKSFRLTPESVIKIEAAENESEYVEKAIIQYKKLEEKPISTEIKNVRIEF